MLTRALIAFAVVACGAPPRPAATPPPVAPLPPAQPRKLVDGDVTVFTADLDAAYWADGDGVVWRRRWDGAPARLAAVSPPPVALRTRAGRVYAATATTLVTLTTDGARPVATGLPEWQRVAIDDTDAWFGTGNGVFRVPLGGGGSEQLANGLGAVAALTSDADAVYVAAVSAAPDAVEWQGYEPQVVLRIGKRDGAVTTLAGRQYGIDALVARDGRVWWSSRVGPALASVDVTTGRRRVELGGHGGYLVDDGQRSLIAIDREALAQVDDRGGLVADGVPALTLEVDAAGVALAGDGVVARLRDDADGAAALWWLPRPDRTAAPARLITGFADAPSDLAVGDDRIVIGFGRSSRRRRAPAPPGRIVVVPRRGGAPQELAQVPWLDALAADGDRVAFASAGTVGVIAPGERPRTIATDRNHVTGVALTADAVVWAEGDRLWRAPWAGGAPQLMYAPDRPIVSTHPTRAAIAPWRDGVVFGTLGVSDDAVRTWTPRGVAVIHTQPADGESLGESVATVGADVVATTDSGAVVTIPATGSATVVAAELGVGARLFGGDRLEALAASASAWELRAIDPRTGRSARRFGLAGGFGLSPRLMAADPTAIYAVLERSHWLVAIPRSPRTAASAP